MSLLEKLQLIQTTLHVSKSQRNNFGKYNYRSAEDILEAIKPISKELGVMFQITEDLVERGGYLAIKSTATIYDLELDAKISSDAYAIIDFDAKGMQNPQRTGASSSYAKKYALGNLLLIDDTKDSDATNNHNNNNNPVPTKKPLLRKGSKSFEAVVERLKKKTATIEQIKTHYTLSDSLESEFKKL